MRFISKNTLFIGLAFLSYSLTNNLSANEVLETSSATHIKLEALDAIEETFGQRYSFESKQLAEKRELLIHLPKDYQESSKQYPVLYVLDGGSHFKHAVIATNTLQQYDMMPASIIVAIPNNTGKRNRDVSTGRDKFSDFIKQEVMTYIDENYKTSGHNTLFGHSSMGFVTLELFAKEQQLFDNYIAASPAVDHTDTELLEQIEQLFAQDKLTNKALYFTATNKNREMPGFTEGAINLEKLFSEKAPKDLLWRYNFIPGQQHMTTPYVTLYQGLSMVFNDYQAPVYDNYQDYVQSGAMQGFTELYLKRGKKYSISNEIPEQALINLTNMLVADSHNEEALEILLAHSKENHDALRTFNALADIYQKMENPQQAIVAYQKAMEIAKRVAPQYAPHFKNQITKVENEMNKS